MQPIVLRIVNKNGFGDYTAGIAPVASLLLPENLNALGVLGNVNESLFNAAINKIIASGKMLPPVPSVIERDFTDAKSIQPLGSEMYLEDKN